MSQGRRNRQLPRVANALLDALWRQVRGERGREQGREYFNSELLSDQRFVDFATAWWPPLDAPTVLSWLHDPEFLHRVSDGILTPEEQRLLTKSWGTAAAVTVEDVPLIDELRYALGDVPLRTDADHDRDDTLTALEGGIDLQELTTAADREYAPSGRAWAPPTHRIEDDGYAHVLIDEAQDLTPMQWRMVGRRGRTASWTIVGDPAQSSWPIPAESAAARAEALEGKQTHEFHLVDQLPQLRRDLRVRRRLRPAGRARRRPARRRTPHRHPASRGDRRRPRGDRPRGGARRRGPGLRHRRHRGPGRAPLRGQRLAGVVARARRPTPPVLVRPIDSSVTPSGEDRVVVLTGLDTKGLEFDGIVVVRPQEIEDESATGRATLYVVLTRATQLLTTVN